MNTASTEILLQLPEIRRALEKQAADKESQHLAARIAVLDQLEAAESEESAARTEEVAEKQKLDAARLIIDDALKASRAAENIIREAGGRRHGYETALRINHGERAVIDAEVLLKSARQGLERELALYESIRPIKAPGGLYNLPLKPKIKHHIEHLSADIKVVDETLESIVNLRRARISPRELNVQVDAILESALPRLVLLEGWNTRAAATGQ